MASITILLFGLFGCDYLAQKELRPGESTVDDVRRRMGRPEMIWEERDGSQTLEYVRGPEGVATYMVEIGPDGRYRRMANVLVAETFAKVRPGMTRDDVRRLLGKPTETQTFRLKQEEVWSWRHESVVPRTSMFNVHFGLDGVVRGTSDTPDPRAANGG